ncbi:FMN-binding protein [Anaerorhabdus sp.]|uniref:FMN-binding protein n=1 Tax=Anaerorhabdus sp. TaxID=1872524 RepID=UPI002FC92B58
MKKIKYILFGIMCFIALVIITTSILANQSIKEIHINNVDLSKIEDGTYLGEYSNSPVKARVEVNVVNHKITEINLLEHVYALGEKGEVVLQEIIAKQTLEVDMKTGATVSSMTIVKAIENALEGEK